MTKKASSNLDWIGNTTQHFTIVKKLRPLAIFSLISHGLVSYVKYSHSNTHPPMSPQWVTHCNSNGLLNKHSDLRRPWEAWSVNSSANSIGIPHQVINPQWKDEMKIRVCSTDVWVVGRSPNETVDDVLHFLFAPKRHVSWQRSTVCLFLPWWQIVFEA